MPKSTGFYARFDQIQIDGKQFTAAMERGCRELIHNAAKTWLIAVVKEIPIRTGFLVGAFSGLEELLGINAPKFGQQVKIPAKFKGGFLKYFSNLKNRRLELLQAQTNIQIRIDKLSKELTAGRSREQKLFEGEASSRNFIGRRSALHQGASEGLDSAEAQRNNSAHEKAVQARIDRLKKQYVNLNKRIERINKYDKSKVGRGKSDVYRELNDLRKELSAALDKSHDLNRHAYNPRTGYKRPTFEKEYVDVEKKIAASNKDKLAALRARKKGIQEKVQEEVVKETKLRRKLTSPGLNIYAHKEFYTHYDGRKVLKTPRSGVDFTTPLEKVFGEFTPDELFNRLDAQAAAASNARDNDNWKDVFGDKAETFANNVNQTFVDSENKRIAQELRRSKAFFSFQFEVTIRYYSLNDEFTTKNFNPTKINKNGQRVARTGVFAQRAMPWHSQRAGSRAFYAYIQSNAARLLPKIDGLVTTRKVIFSGQNVPQVTRTELNK